MGFFTFQKFTFQKRISIIFFKMNHFFQKVFSIKSDQRHKWIFAQKSEREFDFHKEYTKDSLVKSTRVAQDFESSQENTKEALVVVYPICGMYFRGLKEMQRIPSKSTRGAEHLDVFEEAGGVNLN